MKLAFLATATALACLVGPPAPAQIDLTGSWEPELAPGDFNPLLANYLGVPLSADGRAAALAYSDESLDELGRQCSGYSVVALQAPFFRLRIWPDTDPARGTVVAWHLVSAATTAPMTAWVDGRAPPSPQALHTRSGFTTGRWEGDTLVASTTHLIDGLLTLNGVPSSNQATMTLFITRYDDLLAITFVVHDPVYLAAPYVVAQSYRLSARDSPDTPPDYCAPAEVVGSISDGAHTVSYLPGGNPLRGYMREHYGIPLDAALGGPQTMYPDFRRRLRGEYTLPTQYCTRACCGAAVGISGIAEAAIYDRRVLHCTDSLELVLR